MSIAMIFDCKYCRLCVVGGFIVVVVMVCYFIRLLMLRNAKKADVAVYDEEGSIVLLPETRQWGSELYVRDGVSSQCMRSKSHRA